MNPWEIITTAAVVCGVVLSALIQFSGKSQWQGQVGARLDAHDQTIKEIKEVNQRQWDQLGDHGNDISAIQATLVGMNSHGD